MLKDKGATPDVRPSFSSLPRLCLKGDAMTFAISTISPASGLRLSPYVSLAISRHLLAEQGRGAISIRDSLNAALIEVAELETAYNIGRIDAASRDRKQAALQIDALLDAVLRAEAEQLVLEEIYARASSYAIDRVIAYHVRRALEMTGVLSADQASRDALLDLSQAVRVYLEGEQSDLQDMAVRSAWGVFRRYILPIRAG